MMARSLLSLTVVLFAGSAMAADGLKSGPQVGEGVPGGFGTVFLNGMHTDKRRCPV